MPVFTLMVDDCHTFLADGMIVHNAYELIDPKLLNTAYATGFATGGYTGEWTSGRNDIANGKLAFLHQKELVLNQNDTSNMLKMVAMARDALDNVTLGSRLSGYKATFGKYNSSFGASPQQSISIEAHFPNVVDRYEIEQAFNNLANYAAQNAYNLDFSDKVNIF